MTLQKRPACLLALRVVTVFVAFPALLAGFALRVALPCDRIVGDPEDVVDEYGRLPRDRRTWNVIEYRYRRIKHVEALRQSIAAQQEKVAATRDRSEKSTLKLHLSFDERRLRALLAVPRLRAEQMCADCYTPTFQHTSGGNVCESRPCPRWPMHAARMERVWEMLRSASERTQEQTPEPPKPQPLATLPGNLAIGEVIERLKELQEKGTAEGLGDS